MLAPAFFLPWQQTLALKPSACSVRLTKTIYLHNQRSSDIHDQSAVLVHPTCRLMPLSAPDRIAEAVGDRARAAGPD